MLVENPMAANLPQCDTRIQACQAAGVIYMQCRASVFAPVHRKVRELIDEGRFGDVWQVFSFPTLAAQWTKDGNEARPWYVDPANSGPMWTRFASSVSRRSQRRMAGRLSKCGRRRHARTLAGRWSGCPNPG